MACRLLKLAGLSILQNASNSGPPSLTDALGVQFDTQYQSHLIEGGLRFSAF